MEIKTTVQEAIDMAETRKLAAAIEANYMPWRFIQGTKKTIDHCYNCCNMSDGMGRCQINPYDTTRYGGERGCPIFNETTPRVLVKTTKRWFDTYKVEICDWGLSSTHGTFITDPVGDCIFVLPEDNYPIEGIDIVIEDVKNFGREDIVFYRPQSPVEKENSYKNP